MAYNGNPDYTVTIQSFNTDGPAVIVRAPLSEEFMYDIASDYEAPFAQGLTGNAMIDTLLRIAGTRFVTQGLTAQFWQGSTSTELGLELEFQTETDPVSDVRDPIVALLKLCTPGIDSQGLITSPGPQIETSIVDTLKKGVSDEITNLKTAATNTATAFKSGKLNDPNGSVNGPGGTKQTTTTSSNAPLSKDSLMQNIKNQVSIKLGSFAYFDTVVITNVQKTYSSIIDSITGLPMHAKVSLRFKPLFMIVQSDLDNIFLSNRMGLTAGSGLASSLGTSLNTSSISSLSSTLTPSSGNTWTSSFPINGASSSSAVSNAWSNAPQPMKGSY